MYTPVNGASPRWTEYLLKLKQYSEFSDENKRAVENFDDVVDLQGDSVKVNQYLPLHTSLAMRAYVELTRSRSVSLAKVISH